MALSRSLVASAGRWHALQGCVSPPGRLSSKRDKSGDPAAPQVPSDAGPRRGWEPGCRDCGAGRAPPPPGDKAEQTGSLPTGTQ